MNSSVLKITTRLRDRASKICFEHKVGWYYNPLDYAWPVHRAYKESLCNPSGRALLVGMNPGPWGMGQTGVPFGDPQIVGDWMGLGKDFVIKKPASERDSRPVNGFDSERREGSGQRLYGFLKECFGNLKNFFEANFVISYCPLLMFTPEAKNLTPPNLLKKEKKKIYSICDPYLKDMINIYSPEVLVGIGKFATERLREVSPSDGDDIFRIPHPSPANPEATRNGGSYWRSRVKKVLTEANLIPTS